MTAKLSDLSTLANKLNQSTDQVNKRIRDLSAQLEALNIGLETWLDGDYLYTGDYHTPEDDEETIAALEDRPAGATIRYFEVEQLGFAKAEDHWQLAARAAVVQVYDDIYSGVKECRRLVNPQNVRPLLKAARHLRISALPLLEKLTDQIKTELEESLKLANPSGLNDADYLDIASENIDQLRVDYANDSAGMTFDAYVRSWVETLHSELDADKFMAAFVEVSKRQ